jgi:hypothetical protein
MWSTKGQIYGFDFEWVGSDESVTTKEGGVIVPHNTNVNDPSFSQALKVAIKLWEFFNADAYLRMMFEMWKSDIEADKKYARTHADKIYSIYIIFRETIEEISKDSPIDAKKMNVWYEFANEVNKYRTELYIKSHATSLISNITKKDVLDPGYVYLLQSPTKYRKIGKTKNPNNRLKTFSVKLPFEVEYEALIQTNNMSQLEVDLHNLFASKRVNGEWFDLSPEDVEYIKGLAE